MMRCIQITDNTDIFIVSGAPICGMIEALYTQKLELMHSALLVSGVRLTVALVIKVISQMFIKIDLLTLDRLTKIAHVGKEGVLMNNPQHRTVGTEWWATEFSWVVTMAAAKRKRKVTKAPQPQCVNN